MNHPVQYREPNIRHACKVLSLNQGWITFQICVLHDVDNVISAVDLRRPVRTVLRHEDGGLARELHWKTLRVHDVPVKDVELKKCVWSSRLGRIAAMYREEPNEPPQLVLYLVR